MNRSLFLGVILASGLLGCTDNAMVRRWGGSTVIKLPCGERLFTVTWKTNDLWYATRKMSPGEEPMSYTFKERSSLGMMEGTVTLVECR